MESSTSPGPSYVPDSAGERRLTRLVVPAPSVYEPHQRIDWIHDPLPLADADQADDRAATETADGDRGPRLPEA